MGLRFVRFKCGHVSSFSPALGLESDMLTLARYPCADCARVLPLDRVHGDGKGFIVIYRCGHWIERTVTGVDDRSVAPPTLVCEDCQPPHRARRIPIGSPKEVEPAPPRRDAGEFVKRRNT